jgi:hypothetical protein
VPAVLALGAAIVVASVVVLVVVVMSPPHSWRRWRHLTRPVRRRLRPTHYDRFGNPR